MMDKHIEELDRQEFEPWFISLFHPHHMNRNESGSYYFIDANVAWTAWQERGKALLAKLEAAEKERDGLREKVNQADNEWHRMADRLLATGKRAEAAEARLLVPEGYCIMPESLTAENGAKGALSGEFFTETDITCEECGGDCDEDDPCEHCNDLGIQTVRAVIGWSTIKDIYKMAVDTTAIRAAGFKVEGDKC
ncbi:hypothetical protein [Yersinia frederiksenii]|uniref:hypothetical protein n=1 Tax=Yersinia frederiksenii TaxID=29484 RepID=UPI00070BA98C|nr:hypothetical protein [Yersinia frederiksenii]